jgi:peroxiredoxin
MSVEQLSTTQPDRVERRKLSGLKPLRESRIERNGIKAGSLAPDFTLPDLNGRSISLEQYRGRRLVLIFSDPHCGPCAQLAPYLVRVYGRRRDISTEILVISRGDLEENRQKAQANGFTFPVVLQDRWKLSKKYGIFATPVAFVITADGRIERDVAIGFEQIRAVLREEFKQARMDRCLEAVDDISDVVSSSLSRRQMFRLAAGIAVGTLFSVIGMQKTAAAFACSAGYTACGSSCCNSTQICCSPFTSVCCSTSLVCCNGKCCAPGETCVLGSCTNLSEPH